MILTKKVTSCEAKEILEKVYNADRSSSYATTNCVSGSVILAIYKDNEIVIHSNYYSEFSLKEITGIKYPYAAL